MAEEHVSAYLVEVEPRGGPSEVGTLASRARGSANGVRFLRSIYVPEDDRWFLLYEGSSADDVAAAAKRADALVVSIAQAGEVPGEIPELTDVSSSSGREAGVHPGQLWRVNDEVGPGRVDESLEEDR
jgi:hypothetical protein